MGKLIFSSLTLVSTVFCVFVAGEVFYNCKTNGKAALTFDDGPHREYTALVLDVLKAANVTATFFLTGINGFEYNETRYRATVKRMFEEGHQIGSHTWNHPDNLTDMSENEIRNELSSVSDLIYDILGVNMTVFRPPHGFYNDRVLKVLGEFGYDTIMWNVDTEDWLYVEDTTSSIGAWIDAINAIGKEGSYIGLHHDPMSGFTNLTQWVIDVVSSANLTMTTIADCIEKPMYTLPKTE